MKIEKWWELRYEFEDSFEGAFWRTAILGCSPERVHVVIQEKNQAFQKFIKSKGGEL